MRRSKAILVVSFGTCHPDALEKNIGAIENSVKEAFPDRIVRRAFTSGTVREKIWKRDHIRVDDVHEALERLLSENIFDAAVLPTHVIGGEEYERIIAQCAICASSFDRLRIGVPLLSSTEDFFRVIRILARAFDCPRRDCALVLMGHGSETSANTAYAAMDYMFKQSGFFNVFVGTVQAYPDGNMVLEQVRRAGYRKAILTPLMTVAGEHAGNDMAGSGEKSWKTIFEAAGISVTPVLRGLGEYPEIRSLYLEHLKAVL